METVHITAGAIIIFLIGVIGFFLKYMLSEKDAKISQLARDFNIIENDIIRMKSEVKGEIAILNSAVSENRIQLQSALNSVNKLYDVNTRIEKQLDRANSINENVGRLLEKIMNTKF